MPVGMTAKVAAGIVGRTTLLAVALALAVYYFSLGWFLPVVWAVGAVLALALSRREGGERWPRLARGAFIVAVYAVMTVAVWQTLFGRRQTVGHEMMIENRGRANSFGEDEVVLHFASHPAQHVGLYSNELGEYLTRRGRRSVRVDFEVTRDLGCFRGFRATRIDTLRAWRERFGYSGATGDAPPPWRTDPAWCR